MIKLMQDTFYKEKEVKRKLCDFIMHAERLSMGEKCQEFEERFSEYQGRKYSVLFNSGSSANLALIQALLNLDMISVGDNIGVSGVTWATNVMPLLQLGLNPVPIDISLENFNVNSVNLLEALSKNEMRAVFLTNLLGFCGDLDRIREICNEKGILFIEDNCESLGSSLKDEKLGNFGTAGTFSFFVGHHLSTIEGGMVCTDDYDLYNMLKIVRAHGWGRNLSPEDRKRKMEKEGVSEFYELYTFYHLGYNLRPTEITGFLGIEQLKYQNEMNEIRSNNFKLFRDSLKINANKNVKTDHMSFISNFAFPLVFEDEESFNKHKKRFGDVSEVRPIVGGSILLQPFFKEYMKKTGKVFDCPNSEKIHNLCFYFPNHPTMTDQEKRTITDLLEREY